MGPNEENIGKRILEIDGGQMQNANNANTGEEQLIAFGEATVEDVGMGPERNSRIVTFELSQIDGGQTQNANNANTGEEQLIAFGEATVEDVGMGPERNSRTVTFELSQRSEDTTSPPPLISSDNASR